MLLTENNNKLEPVRKRSKLVLPAPQISDLELEEVVKLGLASEQARQQAEESAPTQTVTGQLLGDYQMTPDITRLRTPQIPSSQDTILTESQNILALQIVDTPLKGGLNTPLHNSDFGGATPSHKPIQTPNTMFQTPFRTPHGEITATPTRTPRDMSSALVPINQANDKSMISHLNGSLQTPSVSTIRDKLSINPEEALSAYDDKAGQRQYLDQLKKGLSKLPAPKNDYEIVLPEDEKEKNAVKKVRDDDEEGLDNSEDIIMDQSDVEIQMGLAIKAKYEEEMRDKSMSIQRNLPRPSDMNHNILRPGDMAQPLSDYQRAEEMIKEEMLIMLHHDALYDPTLNQCGVPAGSKVPANKSQLKPLHIEKHHGYLRDRNGYQKFTRDEISQAKELLEKEIPIVRKAMGHGELTAEAFAQVWQECYAQVLFVPNSNRFTRASVTSRKDKIESYEKKLEVNRFHMSKEAKKAGKLDQKLKITLGGYQVICFL
jgi:pre-mRNA-splicing factor CDC5/CEF1